MKFITHKFTFVYTQEEVDSLLSGTWNKERSRAMKILSCECERAVEKAEQYRTKAKNCFLDTDLPQNAEEELARKNVVDAYNILASYYISYADKCIAASEKI